MHPSPPLENLPASARSGDAPADDHRLQDRLAELEVELAALRSQQRETEQARAHYFDLYESAPLGYLTLEADGRIAEANAVAARLLGFERAALLRRDFTQFICAEDRGLFSEGGREPAPASGSALYRVRVTRGDGVPVWMRLDVGAPVGGLTRVTLIDITNRKRLESTLAEGRIKLDAIVDGSGAAVWEVDLVTNVATYSPAFHRLLGLEDGSLGSSREAWRAHAMPEELSPTREQFERHLSTDKHATYRSHFRLRHADGSILSVISSGRVLEYAPDGSPSRMVGCLIDVTMLSRAEAAARASEENLRTVIESMHAGVLFKDGEGRWLIANQILRRFMGVEGLDCIGRTDAELAQLRPELETPLAQCIDSDNAAWAAGRPVKGEEHVPGEAGVGIFEVVKVPLFHSDGSRRGLLIVAEDQTESRLREAHLRERDAQFTALAAHAPGILYEFRREVDGHYSFPYLSGNTQSLYGEGPEIFRRDAYALLAYVLPEDMPQFQASVQASFETMTTWQCDYRIRRQDGSVRWLRGASTPRRMEDGAVQWSGFIHDITQLKDAEAAELNRGKREVIERLAGGVAHDFNNYLTSIRVSAELLRELPDAPSSVAELCESLLHEIDAAARVARQLLAFTKDQPLRHERVRLTEFLAETAAFALRGSGVSAQINLNATDLTIETDPVLLQQVLFNLLINAREAMDGRGRIEIGARVRSDGMVHVRVSDSGPGIPVEQRGRIFDPYFTSKANGSGLGLHVVRSLLGRLGGEIQLDGAAASGAAFDLTLPPGGSPISPVPRRPAPPQPRSEIDSGPNSMNPHVLLLDDEEVQIWLLKRFLGVLGLTHEAFSDGAALIASADRHREGGRDIVCLLDITVKDGQGGLEIAQPLRAALPNARIILVSGYTDAWEERADSLSALNIRFIAKPYTLPDLREMILGTQP